MNITGWTKARDGFWYSRSYTYTPRQIILTKDYVGVIRDDDEYTIMYATELEGIAIADTSVEMWKLTDEEYAGRPKSIANKRKQVEEETKRDIVSVVMDDGYLRLTELNFEEDSRGRWQLAKRSELPPGFPMTAIGLTD